MQQFRKEAIAWKKSRCTEDEKNPIFDASSYDISSNKSSLQPPAREIQYNGWTHSHTQVTISQTINCCYQNVCKMHPALDMVGCSSS